MSRRAERPFVRLRVALAGLTLAISAAGLVVANAQPAAAGPGCGDIPVLSQTCHVVTDPVGTAASAAGSVASDAAQGVFDAMTTWVIDGAKSLVSDVADFIDRSTKPDPQAAWFQPSYHLMIGVGVAFLLPMLLFAVINALVHQDPSAAARAAFIKLPLACIGMYAATTVVGLLVAVSDNFSSFVGSTIGHSGAEFGKAMVAALSVMVASGNGIAPMLVALFGALMAFVVWVELVIRQAAVMIAVLFLPLGFAGLLWPAAAKWFKRLAEGLLALILSKFVITAIIGVGAAAMASGSFSANGFGNVVMGTAILLLAVFAPYALFKIIPVAELGLLAGFEGMSRRPMSAATGAVNHASNTQMLLASRAGGSTITSSGGAANAAGGGPGGGAPIGVGGGSTGSASGAGAAAGGVAAGGAAGGGAAAGGVAAGVAAGASALKKGVQTGTQAATTLGQGTIDVGGGYERSPRDVATGPQPSTTPPTGDPAPRGDGSPSGNGDRVPKSKPDVSGRATKGPSAT
jgi:hypothetical protein